MTSNEWSSSVVSVRYGDGVVNNNNTAANTTAPNRRTTSGSAVVSVSASCSTSGSPATKGAVQPFTTSKRTELVPLEAHQGSAAADVSHTYWKPSRNEVGLLEALHRRTSANQTYLLVSSRPAPELQRNFSRGHSHDDENVNLDSELFKCSKTTLVLQGMERHVADEVAIDGRTLKQGMRENLPQLHQDDYYLVRYRDYSDWAVRNTRQCKKKHNNMSAAWPPTFPTEVHCDTVRSPEYVVQCFAVRVGQSPGAFVPITEPQYLMGLEILEQQKHTVSPAQVASKAVNLFALNADQFRSLSAVAPSAPQPGSTASGLPHQSHASSAAYVPPSAWNWTPSAIERRLNHFLEDQYRSVGRLVVKGVVVGLAVYFFVEYVRRGTGLNRSSQPAVGSSRRRGSRSSQQGSTPSDQGGSVIGSVVSSVFLTGPKEVFDFVFGRFA
eukprot:CAMPEP_0176444444 /NCGR_PEP_ID=MMETSP0127-20121128/23068_1 /TAXON_ID=938130 /ORGANISM="Platyophrya macrostoma, Strain WH" /LENGTH=439 /DNA_ID=CAMNT_0017829957 /DNA_START=65 /DNA_END=1384 /DNA_ORIENTATION=-